MNSVHDTGCAGALGDLPGFRQEFYRCLTRRADALFELCEAMLCAEGPVSTLAGLSLVPEHRRGHGGLYDAVAAGGIDIARVRRTLAGLPVPRDRDGRITLAVDVSPWLRPDEPVLAVVPAPVRSGTHLPLRQADSRLDPAPYPHRRAGRSLDLADVRHEALLYSGWR